MTTKNRDASLMTMLGMSKENKSAVYLLNYPEYHDSDRVEK